MRKRFEKRLDAEMQFHLDAATEGYMADGLPEQEARRRALAEFGALELAKDEVRDLRTLRWIEQMGRDLRYAAWQFYHSPAFTLAVVFTLGVAIAANTAIFSVVRAVLLQPLPYRNSSRLVCIWHGGVSRSSWYTFSYPRLQYFQQQLRNQAELAAYDDEIVTASLSGEAVRLEGGRVSANFFSLLGVKPALGRLFRANEDRHGATPVVLLSNRFWRQRFGADPNVLGRALRIDDEDFTVIGVLPADFQFLGVPVDVWRSRIVDTRTFAPTSVQLGASYLTVVARLHPGATLSQLRTALMAVHELYARDNAGNSDILGPISADGLQQRVFGQVRLTLVVLWGAVTCLLLIACANVANLVLARAISRYREISVRMALGASRLRLAQQLMAENLLLSMCSLLLSAPLAVWGTRTLVKAFRQTAPAVPEVSLDFGVMSFTLAIASGIGLVMGGIPLGLLMRGHAQAGLRNQGRNFSSSKSSMVLRNGIVSVQVAASVILLSATTLLVQSLIHARTMATGIVADEVTVFPLDLMPTKYNSFEQRVRFYDETLRRVEAIPGIRGAAIASRVDFVDFGLGYLVHVEGIPDLGLRNPGARGRSVTPDYFHILGIPLLRGRVFNEHDTSRSSRAVIINEAFAKKFFPGSNPIGKHITYSTDRIYCEIVGVVGDVRSGVQDTGADEQIYLPLSQRPWLVAKLLVRTANPQGIARAVRDQIRAVDPEQAVAGTLSLEQIITNQLGRPRTTTFLVAIFATSAIFLVAVGIYGVITYSVAQRRKEIGIRMALGADSQSVRLLVFRQTFRFVAAGFLIGLPASTALSRFYSNLLFDVRPGDPVALAGSGAVLLLVAFVATYIPAAAATREDPTIALRID